MNSSDESKILNIDLIKVIIFWLVIATVLYQGYNYIQPRLAGYEKEDVERKIQDHLYEKYGEEFVVSGIGLRRSRDREFYQAQIYPKSIRGTKKWFDDYYHATASLYKDTGGIGDGYGIVKMNLNAEEYLIPKVQEIFGERVKLKLEINYRERIDDSEFFRRYLKHDFEKKLEKVRANPDDKRIKLDLDVYVFDRIENNKEKEERREDIFEFIQYLQDEGLFEYLEMSVMFIDERVLASSYDEFEREINRTSTIREVVDEDRVEMPPKELRQRMSKELQQEIDSMSEKELLENMMSIKKSDLHYEEIAYYNRQYLSWICSLNMLKETRSSRYKREKEENILDFYYYEDIDNIMFSKNSRYLFDN